MNLLPLEFIKINGFSPKPIIVMVSLDSKFLILSIKNTLTPITPIDKLISKRLGQQSQIIKSHPDLYKAVVSRVFELNESGDLTVEIDDPLLVMRALDDLISRGVDFERLDNESIDEALAKAKQDDELVRKIHDNLILSHRGMRGAI